MTTKSTRRAAVYVRISVTSEESVSIDRQIEAAEQYASSRGWQVVGTFRDEGVSATHNKPEDRAGWRALLASPEKFDVVIVWKVDRLARRVLDFLTANEAVKARGAGIVAVEDPIDMTTAQGEAFAIMLAVFGQMEAAAIRARVAAARRYLIQNGRVVGGTVPYGWRSVPNPDGAGYVLAQDPERIDYVRGMVDRTLAGASIYSTVQWLDEIGAPLPSTSQANRKGSGWRYNTVENLLRHPVLAGMTPFNPGNTGKVRGGDVLRDAGGLPVVDESVAIMPEHEWRAMVKALDERATAQSKPVALRAKTSALLSGLVYCSDGTRMHRGTVNGRHGYYCPSCYQSISNFEQIVVDEFLRQKGERVRWTVVNDVYEGAAAQLPKIEQAIADLTDLLKTTKDRRQTFDQLSALYEQRDAALAQPVQVVQRLTPAQDFAEDWAQATTVEEKRAILGDAIERVTVSRARPGRRTDAQVLARLEFDWRFPDELGPLETPDDATLAAWAESQ